MANITQGLNTHLYHVLTTLGNLYRIYADTSIPDDVKNVIHGTLEKQWAAADQGPFLASVLLNPFLRGKCFSCSHLTLMPIGLCNILKDLHLQFFGMDPGSAFQATFMDYHNKYEEFSPEHLAQD